MPAVEFEHITEEDIEHLREVLQSPGNEFGDEVSETGSKPGPDPEPIPDGWDAVSNRIGPRRLTKRRSRALVELADETTDRVASALTGYSEATIERHRAHWNGGEDLSFSVTGDVDDRLCGAMRCAAHEGAGLAELAGRHDLAKATVQHHVSASSSQECSHAVSVRVPRVEFDHGGLRGGPSRERNEKGQFA